MQQQAVEQTNQTHKTNIAKDLSFISIQIYSMF